MSNKMETNFEAIIFHEPTQGLWTIFGPHSIFELISQASDVSVVTRENLNELPPEFITNKILGDGTVRGGKDFGLGDGKVLMLPWAILPDEFNPLFVSRE